MEVSLQKSFEWMDAHKTIAENHSLDLIAYEGGQHLVASPKYHNNTSFVDKLTDANRHSRMEDLYCEYFDYWYNTTHAGIFAHFSSHGLYGKYGSWGVKEFMNDTLSPKYLGLQNCIFSYNTPTAINSRKQIRQVVNVYPVPAGNGVVTIEHNLNNPTIHLYNSSGQLISFSIKSKSDKKILLKADNYKGFAILLLNDNDAGFISKKVVF
jgi:hypothetical protein